MQFVGISLPMIAVSGTLFQELDLPPPPFFFPGVKNKKKGQVYVQVALLCKNAPMSWIFFKKGNILEASV